MTMTKNALSKTQVDRLGDRLKGGSHTESELRMLDDYRRSFGEAYVSVVRTIRQGGEFPTGRLAKSTRSIVEKLQRESIRLSQMQDIAGCRIVVVNVAQQERFVTSSRTIFPEARIVDRRGNPSYGYRAVHIIAEISGKPIEIQVRSFLQHMWAELSEESSDVLDPTIKYGGGPAEWRSKLTSYSNLVADYEEAEKTTAELLGHDLADHEAQEMRGKPEDSRREMVRVLNLIADLSNDMISWLDDSKSQKQ